MFTEDDCQQPNDIVRSGLIFHWYLYTQRILLPTYLFSTLQVSHSPDPWPVASPTTHTQGKARIPRSLFKMARGDRPGQRPDPQTHRLSLPQAGSGWNKPSSTPSHTFETQNTAIGQSHETYTVTEGILTNRPLLQPSTMKVLEPTPPTPHYTNRTKSSAYLESKEKQVSPLAVPSQILHVRWRRGRERGG